MSCILTSNDVTGQKVVVEAIRLIGKYAEGFLDIPGYEQERGLRTLNRILRDASLSYKLIPFVTRHQFTMTANKHTYEWSNQDTADIARNPIVSLNQVTVIDGLYSGESSWPVNIVTEAFLLTKKFNEQLAGRPKLIYTYRSRLKSFIRFYPAPDSAYICNINCKEQFDNVDAFTVLNEIPEFWETYILYELARQLKPFYKNSVWTADMEQTYQEHKGMVRADAIEPQQVRVDGGLGSGDYVSVGYDDVRYL